MPYKVPQSKVKQRMVKEAAAKHTQLMQLQQEHSRLKSQHDVLMQCCDLLQWLRIQQLPADDTDMTDADCSIDILADNYVTEEDELQLLQQLHCLPQSVVAATASNASEHTSAAGPSRQGSNCSSNSSLGVFSAALQQTDVPAAPAAVEQSAAAAHQPSCSLSPADDAMQFFRTLMSQPPYPRAQTMTLSDLQDDYAATVCELSMNYAALNAPWQPNNIQEHPLEAIHRLILRHFHLLISMVPHRNELLMAFYASNCSTKQVHDSDLRQQIDRALQHIKLSPQQQQHISDSIALFKRLLAPLVQARQQLQCNGFCSVAAAAGSQAVTAAAGRADAAAAVGPSAAGRAAAAAPGSTLQDGGLSSESSSADVIMESTEHLLQRPSLQQQQKKVTDLHTLMKKEFFLKAVSVCSTVGCLTALQVVQLMVNMFPYPAPMNAVAQEIARRWEQQQQQELAAAVAAATNSSGGSKGRTGRKQMRT